MTKAQIIEYYWLQVIERPSGCFEIESFGEERPYVRVGGDKPTLARLFYEARVGQIPEGAFILHNCHNHRCVNPAHLHIGDQALNMAEKVEAGRSNPGEKNPSTRLTNRDAAEIRRLRGLGWKYKEILELYPQSSRPALSKIARGLRFKTD